MMRPPVESGSGIPVPRSTQPSSANFQRPGNMRQSLAPGRTPLAQTMAVPASNPRQSMFRSTNPLLMSARKGAGGFGQTPARSGQSRVSMWGGSMAPPILGLNQPIKDPRPVREKPFQAQISRTISNFLTEAGSPIQLSPKIYNSPPTSQQYWAVIDWLVRQLDPQFPEKQGTVAVGPNEFIVVLKWFRYPFVDGIDKKSLSTVGGLHSWPAMLAALHYLVSLCIAKHNYLSRSEEPTLQDPEQVPEHFVEEAHHWTLAYAYYDCAYGSFLSGNDEFPEERNLLEQRYAKKDEQMMIDLEQKHALYTELNAELARLTAAPAPLLKLREEYQRLVIDMEKVTNWQQRRGKRIERYREELAHDIQESGTDGEAMDAFLAIGEKNLSQLATEQASLELQVAQQNLSPEEVLRMNAEDASLDRMISDLRVKSRDIVKSVLNLEIVVANRTDSVEQALDEYTVLIYKLGLHPHPPPEFADVCFALELNSGASNPRDLIQGADLRGIIKPALIAVAELKRKERGLREDERVRVENDLDRITMECENLEQEINSLDTRIKVTTNEAEEMRETTQREATGSSAEIARLETELAHARTAAMASGVSEKARLQGLQIAYQEQLEKTERLRDETVRAIVKNTSEMCIFKEQVSEYLNHLRQIAEEN